MTTTMVVESITPTKAKRYLATQNVEGDEDSKNRNVSYARVAQYAIDMRDGFWRVTHQGIAFDEEGRLIDGQHRLLAVIQYGQPIRMTVVRGVPNETRWYLDNGFRRMTQSFLDGQYTSLRAAFLRTMITLSENDWVVDSGIGRGKHSTAKILNFAEQHPELTEYGETYSKAAHLAGRRFDSTSSAGLLIGGFISTRPDSWWEQINDIIRGNASHIGEGEPLKALYRTGPVGGNDTPLNYKRSIYAAEKFREGKQVGSRASLSVKVDSFSVRPCW